MIKNMYDGDQMEKVKLSLYNKNAHLIFSEEGEGGLHICLNHVYEEGDYLVFVVQKGEFVRIKLDPAIEETVLYARDDCMIYPIPFGEAAGVYPPGAFEGRYHIYDIALTDASKEIHDISTNPLDVRGIAGFYPHCTANVETRGESIFAARNTIDGYHETGCHGIWPFTSWGDNEDNEAEIRIDFGREVLADQLNIFLRADFPHDNYWKQITLSFSDGSYREVTLCKTGECQRIDLGGIQTSFVKMGQLIKDETLSSPFPALTYWQVLGREVH